MVVFAVAMAIIVAALGVFVYRRAKHSLRQTVDQVLRARAGDVASLANQADNGLSNGTHPLAVPGANFAQLITPSGLIYDETPGLRRRPLLSQAQLSRARRTSTFIDLSLVRDGQARVFVEPIQAQGRSLVLLVGTSLAADRSALDGVQTALLVGGPIALLLTALCGYLLAGAALRPVERMRARAACISADSPGERLPLPATGDEISRLGRTLNEMLARLEHARERERQFVADASHELRTPLSLLKAEIELALETPHSPAELQASLRSVREETDRLAHLTEDLLVLAQSDSRNLPVRVAEVDAATLAQRMLERFRPRASDAGRCLETDVPLHLTFAADALRIEQALSNLIDNALRHGAGKITIVFLVRGDRVELHVRDEGPGIPLAFRQRAFQRFTRADTARHGEGSGLGLAIVNTIAEAHGGTAVLGSRSDVFLALPARQSEPRPDLRVRSLAHQS
jgi:signal transduction histidine kinase